MTGWRALLRLAVRDARRDRWRTVLVVVMIALPVAGLGVMVGVADTTTATPEERVRDTHGSAALLLHPDDPTPASHRAAVAGLVARLPAQATVQPRWAASDALLLSGEVVPLGLADDAPLEGTPGAPRHRLLEGRLPDAGRGEAVVLEATAERLFLVPGDRLDLRESGLLEVVGVVRRPELLGADGLLLAPGDLEALSLEPTLVDVLVDAPPELVDAAAMASRQGDGGDGTFWVEARADALAYRFTEGRRFVATILGGLGAVEAALIAGAAFAVSVRRRQRELGLVAAVGGDVRQVRQLVRWTGGVTGLTGALVGTALAILVVVGGLPLWRSWAGRELTGVRLDGWWFLGAATIGTASAVVGAWWPARTVARLPVTVALSGRRPTGHPSTRGLAAGGGLAALGIAVLAWTVLARDGLRGPTPYLVGSVLVVLGAGLASPWMLERVAVVAPRLPVGPRLALRDAARFRTRNGPIVTATMAGLAAAVTITAVITSVDTADERNYRPMLAADQLVVLGSSAERVGAEIARVGGGEIARWGWTDVEVTDADGGHLYWAAIADADLATLLAGAEAGAALEGGDVVVLGARATSVVVRPFGADGDDVARSVELPATSFAFPDGRAPSSSAVPTVLLPRDVIGSLRASGRLPAPDEEEQRSGGVLVSLPDPVDDTTAALAVALADAAGETYVQVEQGFRSNLRSLAWGTTLFGAAIGFVLVGVAQALAAAESRADLRTLAAVGADPATRRGLAAARAVLLAGLAGMSAVVVGLVPAGALLTRLRGTGVPLQVPWVTVLVVAVVLPVVAGAVAAAATRRTVPLRP